MDRNINIYLIAHHWLVEPGAGRKVNRRRGVLRRLGWLTIDQPSLSSAAANEHHITLMPTVCKTYKEAKRRAEQYMDGEIAFYTSRGEDALTKHFYEPVTLHIGEFHDDVEAIRDALAPLNNLVA